MYVTSDYFSALTPSYKCAFYMVYEDLIQTQMRFMQDLSLLLQRFSKDLGNVAPLVAPFLEDIKETKNNILEKQWEEDQLETIKKTPGMLMIDVEFEKFNPQKNRWIYFYFDVEKDSMKEIEQLLKDLANIITKKECDMFQEVYKMRRKYLLKQVKEVIEIKPDIKGIGIDLKKAVKWIGQIRKMAKEKLT